MPTEFNKMPTDAPINARRGPRAMRVIRVLSRQPLWPGALVRRALLAFRSQLRPCDRAFLPPRVTRSTVEIRQIVFFAINNTLSPTRQSVTPPPQAPGTAM